MKKFDVAIAGSGIIGASIALELALEGLDVAVFDSQQPGREASWASAGIISPAPESPAMIPLVPLGKASAAIYPQFVAKVEETSGYATGYRAEGTLEALLHGEAQAELNTLIAVHHGMGLKAEPIRASEARELEPSLTEDVQAAILRPDEACVDNRLLSAAVLEAARRSGVHIFADQPVAAIWREGNACAGLVAAEEKIAAKHTVIAAGSFCARIEGAAAYAPVRPAKGQMVALRSATAKIKRVLWSEKVYLVPRDDGRIVAGATVEYVGFDKSVTAGGIQKILDAAIELAPALRDAAIEETWAGLRPDSLDHLPSLGPTDLDGLLIATGHFRSGILLTPITARLIGEWITRQSVSVDWERFSPLRFQDEGARRAAGFTSGG